MKTQPSQVFVVQNDPLMRAAIRDLLKSVGLLARLFASVQEFLLYKRPDVPSCLVIDVRLPGLSGLDLQKQLTEANIHIPVVFATAHGDIPMAVGAMKAGAVDFLMKPFRDQDLLDAIHLSLFRDRVKRQEAAEIVELEKRFESLTSREREILPLILSGRTNRAVATELGTSESTVKAHRRSLIQKMHAASFANLFRMAQTLKVTLKA